MRVLLRLLAIVVCTARLYALPPDTLVLLPFENLSGSDVADRRMLELVARHVESRGWHVIQPRQVEETLEKYRIRYFDSLDSDVRTALLKEAGASAFLSGTIYTWREGENPSIALSARLVTADGTMIWAEIIGVSAADTEGLLGFGRAGSIDDLSRDALIRLLRRFPSPGHQNALSCGRSSPPWLGGPPTFRSELLARGGRVRVAILPFDTASQERIAPRVVADTLAIRLAATGEFDVVEPATLRAAARVAGVSTFAFISSTDLARLAGKVGTSLFLRGAIYQWRDAPARGGTAPPEAQLEISLVDVESGRILWNSVHSRRGDEYEGLLLLGRVTNAVALTDRMITEMIVAERRAHPKGRALARNRDNATNTTTTAMKGKVSP